MKKDESELLVAGKLVDAHGSVLLLRFQAVKTLWLRPSLMNTSARGYQLTNLHQLDGFKELLRATEFKKMVGCK